MCPKIVKNLTAVNSGNTTPYKGVRDAKFYHNLDPLRKPSFNQMYNKQQNYINVDISSKTKIANRKA